ncbi:hypothetical protein CTAYLR_002419 [Chrysophaeum taylorii]|uniref:Uncharacterized protein n=1 Tax=Chrysophaeum taylorii TaxID=2483200 RepID=A0AAD7XTI7_9STRA|nr:hypothetical protein CTAYLR_002419 [Chrysophaeum taylorii]
MRVGLSVPQSFVIPVAKRRSSTPPPPLSSRHLKTHLSASMPRRRPNRRPQWLIALGCLAVLSGVTRWVLHHEVAVAVELSGEVRTLEAVLPSWDEHLLPSLRRIGAVDVFAACVDSAEAARAKELLVGRFRRVRVGIRRALPERASNGVVPLFDERPRDWRVRAAPGVVPLRPAIGWLWQCRGIEAASALRRLTRNYALVVRFESSIPTPDLPGTIFVPAAQSHGGVNDKFAVGDPDSLSRYARLFDVLSRADPASSEAARAARCPVEGYVVQAELCLAWHLEREQVLVQRRRDVRVRPLRPDGSLSPTRRRRLSLGPLTFPSLANSSS